VKIDLKISANSPAGLFEFALKFALKHAGTQLTLRILLGIEH
jgi:hypothetical protein